MASAHQQPSGPRANTGMKHGFSLIEMAMVLVVLGILATLIVPPITTVVQREKITQAKGSLRSVKDEIIGYAMLRRSLPTSLSVTGRTTDAWKNAYRYWPDAFLTGHDICQASDSSLTTIPNLVVKGGKTNATAFVLSSDGPNRVRDILPTGGTLVPTDISAPKDDLVDYVTLNQLKYQVCAASQNTPPIGSDLAGRTAANTAVASNARAANGATISVDNNQVSVQHQADPFGSGGSTSDFGACIWIYDSQPLTTGNCSLGTCTFNKTIDAYFKFTYSADSMGGFSYVVASNTLGASEPSYFPCGQEGSGPMAYAGTNSNASLTYRTIQSPKAGVEFDGECAGAQDEQVGCGPRHDPSGSRTTNNHMAALFWGANTPVNDDNRHNSTLAPVSSNPGYDRNATDGLPGRPVYLFTNPNWLKGQEYEVRVRMDRNTGSNTFNTTAWIRNSTSPLFADLTVDYRHFQNASDVKVYDNRDWSASATNITNLKRVRIGWTMGADKDKVLNVQISSSGFRIR